MITAGHGAIATVFGGTGFLGSRVVKALLAAGYQVRVTARNPRQVADEGALTVVADVRDDLAVARALEGASVVVNAVSLYQEKAGLTFTDIHVDGAARVARHAAKAGVKRLLHVSGLGVSENSESSFVRARAKGERAVRDEFAEATILRPSVMFDCQQGFLKVLSDLVRLPVVPLFGSGDTQLQPAWAVDVAKAMVAVLERDDFRSAVLELGGGQVYSYRQAVELVASALNRTPKLITVAFGLWRPVVAALQHLPNPPLTKDQLILMQHDNIVAVDALGFSAVGIEPRSLEEVLADCLS